MRRRKYAEPVECFSAVAFWNWVKTGGSYSEAVLIETVTAACRGLPDVVASETPAATVATKRTTSQRKARKIVLGGLADLRSEPDSFIRQRDALLVFCRANKVVVGVDDALDFIQQHGFYTGDWAEGLGRRRTRVGGILNYIANTFDPERCRSSRPVVWIPVGRFKRWSRICTGWRAVERITLDEYGRIMRKRDRTVVGPEFLSVFMSVVEYVLITDKNEDDTIPQERAKAIWEDLYRTGQTDVRYCPRKWAVCRNRLEAMGIIRIDHEHHHGQAMKWWPTDKFPLQPKEWKAEKARGMLDPVELGDFLEEKREREQHNESVASLPGIVIDALNVLPYFPGSNCTTEGGHVGTGRIPSRLYGGNHSC